MGLLFYFDMEKGVCHLRCRAAVSPTVPLAVSRMESAMRFNVPDGVVRETKRCPRHFSCLAAGEDEGGDMCEVRQADGQNVLFLRTDEPTTCPYRVLFGYSHVCTCPTRFAIFQKYQR